MDQANSNMNGGYQPTFNELLIIEVQRHPELYDQQHRVCTDNGERNMIWEEIAGTIDSNVSGEFAKKRWLQMRDRYRKELKMALRNLSTPKWPYFEKLSWLDPYLKDAKSSSGMASSLLIDASLEGLGANQVKSESLGTFDSFDFPEFPYASANIISTNTLLENLMAVSSGIFEQNRLKSLQKQQREGAEFSPDSAIASTSEDGDNNNHPSSCMPTANALPRLYATFAESYKKKEGMQFEDTQGNEALEEDRPQQQPNDAPSPDSSNASNLDSRQNELDQKNEDQSEAANSAITSRPRSATSQSDLSNFLMDSLSGAVKSGSTCSSSIRTRMRNPPYLVRRGGGLKVKSNGNLSDTQFYNNNNDSSSALSLMSKHLKTIKKSFPSSTPSTPLEGGHFMNQLQSFTSGLNGDDLKANVDWTNDEDLLFARLIVVRLRKFSTRDRRSIRSKINEWIDEKEEELEKSPPAK